MSIITKIIDIFFMEKHAHDLYNYINSKIKNTEDSKDILQDLLLYLYRKNPQDISNLKGYMINCANFFILNYFKKRKKTVDFLIEYQKDNEIPDTSNNINLPINSKYLIPVKLQINGYSIKEIANILDTNENTIKTRIRRGKIKLKNYLVS